MDNYIDKDMRRIRGECCIQQTYACVIEDNSMCHLKKKLLLSVSTFLKIIHYVTKKENKSNPMGEERIIKIDRDISITITLLNAQIKSRKLCVTALRFVKFPLGGAV